jgi:flavin reductase (DIM6/NTAB) family NADH-FMN oxidoreductase RutF
MTDATDAVLHQSWGTMGNDLALTATLRGQFVDAMSRAVTGVTIVTTEGALGRFGQTVSAMSSVSADPPMLLVCINRKSPISRAIAQHRVFAVNVLRADQRRLSESFSGRPRKGIPYDFTSARWRPGETGSPLLVGAIARFDCVLDAAHEAGTHAIFVGGVVSASSGGGAPLVYARRGYGELHAFPNPRPDDDMLPLETEDETSLKLGDL